MGGATDHVVVDAVRRRLRQPDGWLAVCLHLSRLAGPGVRPHHRLIARVLMEDTARRYEGEVFTTGRGDLLLLCRSGGGDATMPRHADSARPHATPAADAPAQVDRAPAGRSSAGRAPVGRSSVGRSSVGRAPAGRGTAAASGPDPARETARAIGRTERVAAPDCLPSVLARLLHADVPNADRIISAWSLAAEGHLVLACAQEQAEAREPGEQRGVPRQDRAGPPVWPPTHPPVPAWDAGPIRLQMAVMLSDRGVQPLFREVTVLAHAAAGRSGGGEADPGADPFLVRHLARRLDQTALAALEQASGRGGPLDPLRGRTPRMHLNLSLDGVGSEAFGRLARRLLEAGRPVGAEIPLLEACADPEGFGQARRALRDLQAPVILDEVSPLALRLVRASALQPDMVKLVWSPRLSGSDSDPAEAEAGEGTRRLLAELGPDRVILCQTADEDALRWGLAQGIRRFQGPQIDTMLRALRMARCAHAGGCTPAQCFERAAAASTAARRLCANHDLLDEADAAPPTRAFAEPGSGRSDRNRPPSMRPETDHAGPDPTGFDQTASDPTEAGRTGADRTGADRTGADQARTDQARTGQAGADHAGPERQWGERQEIERPLLPAASGQPMTPAAVSA